MPIHDPKVYIGIKPIATVSGHIYKKLGCLLFYARISDQNFSRFIASQIELFRLLHLLNTLRIVEFY